MQRKGKEQDYAGQNKNLINEGINSVYRQRCKSEDLKQKVIFRNNWENRRWCKPFANRGVYLVAGDNM